MGSLTGKVAIVTGSSDGIGRAIAERLAQDGATVIVNYGKSADKAKEVVAGIEAKGGKAVAIQSDMSKVGDAGRLVKDTVKRFGRLDILINNAGMFMFKPLVDMSEEEFDRMFALNTKGPYFALQETAKVIQEGGRIVNISTDGTHTGFGGATAYLGSKGALEQFTKGLAHELAPKGVTVNTVSPGYTITAMLPADPAFRQIGEQASPLKRLGVPKDIADVVAFVVSEEARWLTGQNIHAGGGVVM
ncbi:MAG TPA: glucose 1-dehydrogenase [Nitrospira sp.]|jgi:3-oxoacyl-[acyl-carrier protein] reductase|nr:glucose 1-dehydrogenase [Nitrospira sp.]